MILVDVRKVLYVRHDVLHMMPDILTINMDNPEMGFQPTISRGDHLETIWSSTKIRRILRTLVTKRPPDEITGAIPDSMFRRAMRSSAMP